jgi:hypothetical protein
MYDIEKLTRRRSLTLLFTATAFLFWQGGMALSELVDVQNVFHTVGNGMALVGSLAWVAATIYFVRYQYQVKKARAGCVLDDEWARNVRLQAVAMGSFITFATIAVVYVALSFIEVPVRGAVHLIFVVAIAAPLFAYVIIERRANDGMEQS